MGTMRLQTSEICSLTQYTSNGHVRLNSIWKIYESHPLFLQYYVEIRKYWKSKSLARGGGILSFALLCNFRQGQLTSDLGFSPW